jgi:GAF domain-containing protein
VSPRFRPRPATDLDAVLTAIARNAAKLCEARDAHISLVEAGRLRLAAHSGARPIGRAVGDTYDVDRRTPAGHVTLDKRVVHIRDLQAPAMRRRYPAVADIARAAGHRTVLVAPFVRDDTVLGVILIRRDRVQPFTATQITLLGTFADQAAIAIENARLAEALQARNHELADALERETATSEVLRVISGSPTSLSPVLDTIAARAMRLCEAIVANVMRYDGQLVHVATFVHRDPEIAIAISPAFPMPPGHGSAGARAILTRQIVEIPDILDDRDYAIAAEASAVGFRSVLAVPMLRDGVPLGSINVGKPEPGPFTATQVELLKTFADQAVIAIENVRLFTELQARNRDLTLALEQQTATAEILRTISRSYTDVRPVFQAIVDSATRLLRGHSAVLSRIVDDRIDLAAYTHTDEAGDALLESFFPVPLSPTGADVRPIRERVIGQRIPYNVADVETDPRVGERGRASARARGYRSQLVVPMLHDGEPIGTLAVTRRETGTFSDEEVTLLQTFADQAVIAIENVRLFTELQARNAALTEALEQQTATSEILRVISRSPTDVQPVFDIITRNAVRLCDGLFSCVSRFDGELIHMMSLYNYPPAALEISARRFPAPLGRQTFAGRTILQRDVVHVPDILSDGEAGPDEMLATGFRSVLSVPMLHGDRAVGAITVWRAAVGHFTDRQVELLKTFADQAVIAIENVRLFTELQARNAALTEALEQQTATSEILQVISSAPTQLEPVLKAIAERAARLCDARNGTILLSDGSALRMEAHYGPLDEQVGMELPMDRATVSGRAFCDGRPVHVQDLMNDPDFSLGRDIALRFGVRTILAVPLVRQSIPIGVILIRRTEVRRFTDKQIALLKTFADQAVIAIENVRLFTELQRRNRDLTESLEQQTATSRILEVISSSPMDVQPVFDMIAASAVGLCEADTAGLFRFEAGLVHFVAEHGRTAEEVEAARHAFPQRPGHHSVTARAILARAVVQIPDVSQDPEVENSLRIFRTVLSLPLLREGQPLGAITVARRVRQPFTDGQIALLETFADQAVIAIENVRLFKELEEKNRALTEALEQQTATSEILKVISQSPTDVQPVFDAILANATPLCNAQNAILFLADGEEFRVVGSRNTAPEFLAALASLPRFGPKTGLGRVAKEKRPVHIPDVFDDDAYREGDPARLATIRVAGARTWLGVPLLKGTALIGALVMYRKEPEPFADAQISLLQTFADQAVIAIENVRLFKELEERNRALVDALEQQTATSEILGVISRSPTDAQPVFEAIAANAARLCSADDAQVLRVEGDHLRLIAARGEPSMPSMRRLTRGHLVGRAVIDRTTIHVRDLAEALAEYPETTAARHGVQSALAVPLLRDDVVLGVIRVSRKQVRPFTDKQAALLKTFADQAVIAIENVRLFNELQARTRELTRSVRQLTALGEVGQAVSSTLDVETVLTTIASRASQLAGTETCAVYEYDEVREEFHLRATHNVDERVLALTRVRPIRKGEGVAGSVAETREPVQLEDITTEGGYHGPLRDALLAAGVRAVLAVPLLREARLIGSLIVTRNTPGRFAEEIIALLQTFATQSAIAIQNARLYRELEAKGRELEAASRHKSQFLANMSHELRTPMNAILGYTELMADGIYGDVPDAMRDVLGRVEVSGRHLLGLINDVLDLSKIEAGQLSLTLADYSMKEVVDAVVTAVDALAAEKHLRLRVELAAELPTGRGDQRRLAQVLLNLVGNAIKFTEHGEVAVRVGVAAGLFVVAVSDTGPGVALADQERIFEEFQQADTSTTRPKGGTGLGLAIARRIIAMHGGRIWVESTPGEGATFRFTMPVRVQEAIVIREGAS